MITEYNGIQVVFKEKLSDIEMQKVLNSYKFKEYVLKNISNKNVKIKNITIYKVHFFKGEVGFIYLESDIYIEGKKVPGISFIRGNSVAILPVIKIKETNEIYTILVEQYRNSIGQFEKDLPAGIVDENEELYSTVIKELEEETGLKIKNNFKLIYKFNPSSGGSDETVFIYSIDIEMNYKQLMNYNNVFTGSKKENEYIKTFVITFEKLKKYSYRSLLAYNLYKEKSCI